MPTQKPKKPSSLKKSKANKNIPVALPPEVAEELDVIAKTENTTRSALIRQAVRDFNFNYRNDQLDQRQLKLEKQMKEMERSMRGLQVKQIRISGQILWFLTTIWTHGVPGLPIKTVPQETFNSMWENSRMFGNELLRTKNPLTEEEMAETISELVKTSPTEKELAQAIRKILRGDSTGGKLTEPAGNQDQDA